MRCKQINDTRRHNRHKKITLFTTIFDYSSNSGLSQTCELDTKVRYCVVMTVEDHITVTITKRAHLH